MIHLIETVYRFLWGDLFVLPIAGGVGISLMVVLLLMAGVFFTLRTRLLPVRLFLTSHNTRGEGNGSPSLCW